jgi:hypothetical protein
MRQCSGIPRDRVVEIKTGFGTSDYPQVRRSSERVSCKIFE